MSPMNVFSSSREFSDPAKRGYFPLVNVTDDLQWFPPEAKVSVWIKVMTLPPIFSVKWCMAWNILKQAKDRGELEGITVLVIASSGNTASALGRIARFFGIKYVIAIVPSDIPDTKSAQLEFDGVRVIRYPETPGNTCIDHAARLAAKYGWYNVLQYEDDENWRGQMMIGSQIWEQTKELVTVVGVGMGTMGTVRGLRESLLPHVAVVGGKLAEGNPVPGLRPESRLQPHFSRDGIVEVEVEKVESYEMGKAISEAVATFGPSTGSGAVALKRFIGQCIADGTDRKIRNKNEEIVAVFIGCDLGILYTERYTGVLDPEHFSARIPGLDD